MKENVLHLLCNGFERRVSAEMCGSSTECSQEQGIGRCEKLSHERWKTVLLDSSLSS